MHWTDLNLFTAEEHQPFTWNGGRPGALLLHGFPGTPAEIRPLAEILHAQGWTTRGMLLPGLGSQIDTLFEREWEEWVEAAAAEMAALAAQHRPLLLVGFSLGGAVALNALARLERIPDGAALVLLAPFWQLGSWQQRLIFHVVKPFLRGIRPLRKADFADPRLRESLTDFMPELDLDDAAVQAMLRQFRVPTRLFDNLLGIGKAARQAAAGADLPTLVVQGLADDLTPPERTRRLLIELPGPVTYHEVAAGHDLIQPTAPGWEEVKEVVGEYGRWLIKRSAGASTRRLVAAPDDVGD